MGKPLSVAWMYGRFGDGPPPRPPRPGQPSAVEIAAARRAADCGGLATYLRTITRPWSVGAALAGVEHALSDTTLSFSPDPRTAERELCR